MVLAGESYALCRIYVFIVYFNENLFVNMCIVQFVARKKNVLYEWRHIRRQFCERNEEWIW